METIKELKDQVRLIEKELWELRNPQKFKIGEKAQYVDYRQVNVPGTSYFASEQIIISGYIVVDVKVVDVKIEPGYLSYSREYLIHKNGDRAFWVHEYRLKK